MAKKMGYQGLLYYGTKGSTASTQVTKRVDATYEISVETGSTTSAGDGTSVPIETGEAVTLDAKITFNCIVDDNDAAVIAFQAAAATGVPIALRFIAFTGGAGLDADCVISVTRGAPLKGEQTMDVSVEKLSASDREPQLNV
jgi:hypothetical protein